MLIEGRQQTLKFLIGANRNATARLLKEAALRVPNVLDVAQSIAETLPDPDKVRGFLQEVEDDQITGIRCAFSEKLINLEEDARLCPKCGQIFHKDSVPDTCPDCEAELKGHVLLA
jgi:rubrerythrin